MFEGICIDNGAEKSVASLPAYKRYCAHTHATLDLQPSSESFRMGDVVHSSLGKAKIRMLVNKEGNFIEYSTDVVDVDIPILLGVDMMKQLRWYVNEVTK